MEHLLQQNLLSTRQTTGESPENVLSESPGLMSEPGFEPEP